MDDLALRRRGLDEVAGDRQRGASELARRCLEVLADYARAHPAKGVDELAAAVQSFALELGNARPSMAPVRNLLNRFLDCLPDLSGQSLDTARRLIVQAAGEVALQSQRAVEEVSRHGAALVGAGRTVITHSLSSTVLAVLSRLASSEVRAVITESAPLREGLLLAQALSQLEIDTEYITDAQIGVFAARSDLALVGADSLLRDGAAVNKAGTYLLALAARDAGIPFYVCCERFKFADYAAEAVTLEEMTASEVSAPQLPHVQVRNVYFDITPARLITAVVTEQGVVPTAAHRPS